MGLDMFALTVRERFATADTNPDLEGVEKDELFYWRKHPDLHGWMHRLFTEKGGVSEQGFNGDRVRVTLDDLTRLEADLDALPHTTGFFFGASDASDREKDVAFIAKAREAIAAGLAVYYDSWW
jgi:hypothetical protein